MEIPPETESDAGLPGGGKNHVAGVFFDPLDPFAGLNIVPVLATYLVNTPTPNREIAVQGNDISFAEMKVPAHL